MREKGGGVAPLASLNDSMLANGVIINLITGSTRDERSEAAYVASMHGLEGFTRQAARELSPYGIHVYAVENTGDTIITSIFALFE